MKRLFIFLALPWMCGACSENKEAAAPQAVETVAASDTTNAGLKADSAEVDAVSGATAVANAPSFNGILFLPPQHQVSVTFTMGGAVNTLAVSPGKFVKKGEVLATLKNPEYIVLQQEYLDAAAQTEFLEQEYARQKNLLSHEAASEKKFQQSKADYLSAKSRKDAFAAQLLLLGVDAQGLRQTEIEPYLKITSPVSGYVTNLNGNIGKFLDEGEPICEVVDKRALMVQLTAYEKDLDKIKVGDVFDFHVNGMGDRTFRATLQAIDQMVDNVNRSIKLYLRIEEFVEDFRPGMYVSAQKSH